VKFLRKALIVGGPRTMAKIATVNVTPERLALWESDAWAIWAEMDRVKAGARVTPRWSSCKLFGGCAFLDGCHRLAVDESKFDMLYTRKVWTPWKKR
jgi:hypothetical protein